MNSQNEPAQSQLRLWPGVVIVVLVMLARFGLKRLSPGFEGFELSINGLFVGVALFLIWWLAFSKAPHGERWGMLFLMIASLSLAWLFKHESMGPLWLIAYALPFLLLAFVIVAVFSRHFVTPKRRISLAITIGLAGNLWLLVRTTGIDGDHVAYFYWRWQTTTEDKLVHNQVNEAAILPVPADSAIILAHWPGFRGENRDGIVSGLQIKTDWKNNPPREMWRRAVGPGWSSFAVHGGVLFTQEQRGENELVTCYDLLTGTPMWHHEDKVRFIESNSGAGPRATPSIYNGRLYTLGATGILNALNAADGRMIWSRNVASDTETEMPIWGFAGSPLIIDSLVVTAVASSIVGCDLETGELRWMLKAGNSCYSSPQLMHLDSSDQIVLLNEEGAIGIRAADGERLWQYVWPGAPIIQPAQAQNGDILLTATERSGVRRISVEHSAGNWQINEQWTSTGMRPYFNDFVVHKGHIYGFNRRILACIDLTDGSRKWCGGRYGNGQLILLADQDLLIVLTEKGELALVQAKPDAFNEIARVTAISGKTWNHPVVAGEVLLVRNGQEMAAFRLAKVE